MTPAEIIEGFWSGNIDVMVEIYRRVLPSIRKKFNCNTYNAEEIIQQTLYEVLKAKKTISGNLYSYISNSCNNVANDYFKKERAYGSFDPPVHDKIDDHVAGTEQEVKEYMLKQQAFNQLSEDCKKILNLKYGEKMKYDEVVKAFNQHKQTSTHIDENAARQRSLFCRNKVKAIYEQLKQKKDA